MKIKYGKGCLELPIEDMGGCRILENDIRSEQSIEEIIQEALLYPIGSPRLKDIVKEGETVCIVISDISRYYQRMDLFLPFIIEELREGGVKDWDITFLCATGAHAVQSDEEHDLLLGEKLNDQFTVIDHDCHKKEDMVMLGMTSAGTAVMVNRRAVECDRLILTGAITFHDMAGYGGGRKSVLPGIADYQGVVSNHGCVFHSDTKGMNENCRMGSLEGNLMHEDMTEAAELIKVDFLINVVLDTAGNYYRAVAGNWKEAFSVGTGYCDEAGAVFIEEKADIVIAGCGGYPKDLDLYQASKGFSAAAEAAKEGGVIIVIAECPNGMGTLESSSIIMDFETNEEREAQMRRCFVPEAFSGYLLCELAKKYKLIMVTDYQEEVELSRCGIKPFPNVDQALGKALEMGEDQSVYVLPNAMAILPKIKERIS